MLSSSLGHFELLFGQLVLVLGLGAGVGYMSKVPSLAAVSSVSSSKACH